VATYGQVAALAGIPQQSRLVGRILSRLPKSSKLPWHRVVNSQGKLSNPNPERQKDRLEDEGVTFINGRIRLKSYRWQP
jgi:methylated-DNA-protein-cysteine methyltransferase-like protein